MTSQMLKRSMSLTSTRFFQRDVFPCCSLLLSWEKERVLIAERGKSGVPILWL